MAKNSNREIAFFNKIIRLLFQKKSDLGLLCLSRTSFEMFEILEYLPFIVKICILTNKSVFFLAISFLIVYP